MLHHKTVHFFSVLERTSLQDPSCSPCRDYEQELILRQPCIFSHLFWMSNAPHHIILPHPFTLAVAVATTCTKVSSDSMSNQFHHIFLTFWSVAPRPHGAMYRIFSAIHTHTHTQWGKLWTNRIWKMRAYELIHSSFACQVGISQTSSPWTFRDSPRQLDQLQLSTALTCTVIHPCS